MYQNSLYNSHLHPANDDKIADMQSEFIVSRQQFFADVIFSFTSKDQNYTEKYL